MNIFSAVGMSALLAAVAVVGSGGGQARSESPSQLEESAACWVDSTGERCYASEAEMDAAELGRESLSALADCSSPVRLYSGTGHSGSVRSFTARGVAISLAAYGFDNVTSSYKVGACSARFYDGGTGSALYPGNTSAGASFSSMVSGWDNRVSTIVIS